METPGEANVGPAPESKSRDGGAGWRGWRPRSSQRAARARRSCTGRNGRCARARSNSTRRPARALALVSYFLDSHPEHGGALALKARALERERPAPARRSNYTKGRGCDRGRPARLGAVLSVAAVVVARLAAA